MNRPRFSPQVLTLALSLLAAACATAPSPLPTEANGAVRLSGKTDDASPDTVSPAAIAGSGGTLLAVPSREELKKNGFDSRVLSCLEKGSPDSLREAVSLVNADPRGMTDLNRVTLAVAAEIMKIAYPLEAVNWPIPSVPETNPYIGAVRSARLGVYDYNTGNADFLSLVLPSLVIITGSSTAGDYFADAEAALMKASRMNGDSVLPPRLLALLAANGGKQTAADAWNKKAWELDGSCYPAGIDWCRALVRTGNARQAFVIAQSLQSRYPDAVEVRRLLAETAFATGDWTFADGYVLAALKTEPDNASLLLMRVRILVEQKEYLKANSLLDAYATTRRKDREYLLLRSRVAREWTKNTATALAMLKEAQLLYPDDTEVLLSSAEICYQTNQQLNGMGGRDFVNLVLSKDSSNQVALALLVKDYIGTREWASAVKNAEALVAAEPTAENRILFLRACLGSGDLARALSTARALYGTGTATDEITTLYLDVLVASGDTKTASSVIDARLEGAPSRLKSVLYYYQSTIASGPDSRLASLRSSLLADPRNRDALFSMYEWYMDRKDYRMAQYYLKQVGSLDPANRKFADLQKALDDLLAR